MICYATKPRENLKAVFSTLGVLDYVVFFSPSGVQATYKLMVESIPNFTSHTKIIAIGPTTAECIKDHSTSNVLIASQPNAESILQIIRDNFD